MFFFYAIEKISTVLIFVIGRVKKMNDSFSAKPKHANVHLTSSGYSELIVVQRKCSHKKVDLD